MKKNTLKRIVAFIFFASFCLTVSSANTHAVSFSSPSTHVYFSDYDAAHGRSGNSFALAKITDFGTNGGYTDLEVATQAYNYDFIDNPTTCTTTVEVYATVTVVMNNYAEVKKEDSFTAGSDSFIGRVKILGSHVMDGVHSIIDFNTRHTVTVRKWGYDDSGNLRATVEYASGATIEY